MPVNPPTVDDVIADEPFWKKTLRPFVLSFKNPCNIQSYEVGIEAGIVTYLITRFALKKPQSAFKYTMVAFVVTPLINWPLCVTLKRAALTPKEL